MPQAGVLCCGEASASVPVTPAPDFPGENGVSRSPEGSFVFLHVSAGSELASPPVLPELPALPTRRFGVFGPSHLPDWLFRLGASGTQAAHTQPSLSRQSAAFPSWERWMGQMECQLILTLQSISKEGGKCRSMQLI